MKLENGRRTTLAVVTPIESLKRLDAEETAKRTATALEQLQALATPIFAGMNGSQIEAGAAALTRPAVAQVVDGETAHQSAVAPFFGTGVFFETSAVVSADRRYVRLSMSPTITNVRGLGPNNPLLPGQGNR